jgi:hypothetical protein
MREAFRHHIPISKLKCAFYLVPCLLFGLSGPYAAYCVFVQREGLGLGFILWMLLSPISLTICMRALFSLGRKLIDPKAGLTIADEGIFNDSSPFSSHYLKWSEVESIHLTPNTIEVRALGAEGFTTLKASRTSSKKVRTKINITTDCLQASYEEIVEALHTHQSRPIVDDRPSL